MDVVRQSRVATKNQPRCRRVHSIRPAAAQRAAQAQRDHRVMRARCVDPEPVPNSLEVREVSEQACGHVLGAKTKV